MKHLLLLLIVFMLRGRGEWVRVGERVDGMKRRMEIEEMKKIQNYCVATCKGIALSHLSITWAAATHTHTHLHTQDDYRILTTYAYAWWWVMNDKTKSTKMIPSPHFICNYDANLKIIAIIVKPLFKFLYHMLHIKCALEEPANTLET